MVTHEKYISRCIELAKYGIGSVSPNPMVGAVIVVDNKIIGEGFHQKFGEAHAEVNAINSVKDKSLLPKSTLYVSLEPCSHFGKTPPCTDLIIENKIPNVIIGSLDPYYEVNGKSIEKLKNNGINVISGILEKECKFLNRRFYTFHQKKRPYIILKWAESLDKFIDIKRNNAETKPIFFTDNFGRTIVHKWRTENDAILVGRNTVILDNPQLTARNFYGNNPVRIIIDKNNTLNKDYFIFDNQADTIVFNSLSNEKQNNISYVKIDFSKNIVFQILDELYKANIQSIIIEGGSITLNSFIEENLWDEARIFISNKKLENGVKAPYFEYFTDNEEIYKNYKLKIYYNEF